MPGATPLFSASLRSGENGRGCVVPFCWRARSLWRHPGPWPTCVAGPCLATQQSRHALVPCALSATELQGGPRRSHEGRSARPDDDSWATKTATPSATRSRPNLGHRGYRVTPKPGIAPEDVVPAGTFLLTPFGARGARLWGVGGSWVDTGRWPCCPPLNACSLRCARLPLPDFRRRCAPAEMGGVAWFRSVGVQGVLSASC
jgi:hypothetical protein